MRQRPTAVAVGRAVLPGRFRAISRPVATRRSDGQPLLPRAVAGYDRRHAPGSGGDRLVPMTEPQWVEHRICCRNPGAGGPSANSITSLEALAIRVSRCVCFV